MQNWRAGEGCEFFPRQPGGSVSILRREAGQSFSVGRGCWANLWRTWASGEQFQPDVERTGLEQQEGPWWSNSAQLWGGRRNIRVNWDQLRTQWMGVRRQTWGLGRVTARLRPLRLQPVPSSPVALTRPEHMSSEPSNPCSAGEVSAGSMWPGSVFWLSVERVEAGHTSARPREEANAFKECDPGPRVFEREIPPLFTLGWK